MEPLFYDGDEHIDRHGDPDLGLDGVCGGAEKRLDPQMLLDPFEKQFHLPAITVQVGDGQSGACDVVGQKDERLAGHRVAVFDAAQRLRIIRRCPDAGQHDGLIAQDPRRSVRRVRVAPPITKVGLGADDEERPGGMHGVEPFEVHVAPVHDVESAGLGQQDVQDVDVVQFAIGDVNEGGNAAAQIQERVKLDRPFALSEPSPGKDRQAQIDGRGIQRINGVVEFQTQVLVGVERAGNPNQRLGEVGIDPPVAVLVGVGQSVARNAAADAHVIELVCLRTQAGFDVSQALPVGQLCKRHGQILVVAGERLDLAVSAIPFDASSKRMHGQVIHHLREDELARVHV